MAYLYNTAEQQRQMLEAIGVASVAELFEHVPQELQLQRATWTWTAMALLLPLVMVSCCNGR